ncbi:MAG: hypothetical protein ACLR2E_12115 [Lachnospiraceae bacterium]
MNDYNYDYNPNPEPLDPEPAHSGMETAAIILGILALVGSTCFYLSIPCAAVGILLALLSRGRKEHRVSNRGQNRLLHLRRRPCPDCRTDLLHALPLQRSLLFF